MAKKLTPVMQELLDAMRENGVCVLWVGTLAPYYFRTDTHRACTRTVDALVARGLLVEKVDRYGKRTATLPEPPR